MLTLDIPAIRCAQRALAIFDRLGYPRHKVHVVVNRWSEADRPRPARRSSATSASSVTGYVQSDYRTAVNSINLGQPLVESEPIVEDRGASCGRSPPLYRRAAAAPVAAAAPRPLGSLFAATATRQLTNSLCSSPHRVQPGRCRSALHATLINSRSRESARFNI